MGTEQARQNEFAPRTNRHKLSSIELKSMVGTPFHLEEAGHEILGPIHHESPLFSSHPYLPEQILFSAKILKI